MLKLNFQVILTNNHRPIKSFKENLTLTNLISHADYKSELKLQNLIYDEEIQRFDHKILIKIETPKM